ncbi:Ig-like domain-containing protein [Paenibacillus odorifer]|uniref:Ig-like domain-containing protein n=1 Tax=Paenibacillus odorifer TaxID=189426 RepID=UPI00096E0DBC|nr:hypothetical protein [Paenibacillus odorifer]OMD71210.1 hypothetical protein BSK50_26390 [Paenibacillus odorifer]
MNYKDKYKLYSIANGDNLKNRRIQDMRIAVSKSFMDSPSYSEIFINGTNTSIAAQIVDDSDVKDQKKIVLHDYKIKNGDIIEWNNEMWMNILTDNMSDIYFRGTLRLCCGQVKWIDDEGEINKRYFSFKSDPATNFGTDADNIIVLGSERRTLLVSFDDDTTSFRRDDRFIFDSRVWKITALDNISIKGISIVTVQEDLINTAKDNLDLEIADYYDRIADFKIEIVNGTFATIREDQSLQLNIIVTNKDTSLPSPALSYSVSDYTVLSISSEGLITPLKLGSSIITITYKDASAQIEVRVTDSTAYSYTCEIIGSNEIKVGRTQTYTAKFYRNGVEYPDESRFSLATEDGNQTTLATISTQNFSEHTCSVVAGNSVGYVWLHVENQNGLSMSKVKIKLKPLY